MCVYIYVRYVCTYMYTQLLVDKHQPHGCLIKIYLQCIYKQMHKLVCMYMYVQFFVVEP